MRTKTSTSSDKNIVDRTRKRSAASIVVKDLRNRVNSGAGTTVAFERELMLSVVENHRNAYIAQPLFVAIVAVISAPYAGYLAAGLWFAITLIATSLLTFLSARYSREAAEEDVLDRWRTTFLLAQLLIAFCWSVFSMKGCQSCTGDTWSILQFSTILVFQAITMILSYGFGVSMLVTSTPPTLVLAVRFLLTYDPAHMVMGGIVLGSQAFFYLVADRFKLSVLSILEHKAEKEALIAELEVARSISEEARRRAEEANLAKSRFLATMSHELRTPLNAIMGFSEVMQAEVLGPIGNNSYKGYIDDIHNSGKHLLNVINEILDLSRIEAGRHELKEEALNLVHIIDEARHMVQLKAKAKNITLATQFEDDLPLIWADERAVRQIALNLLSNALKFTPTGGTIWLKVGWTSGAGQYFSVRDTGPGIPEEEIPIVLSSFGQGSIAIKSAEQGSGLGLPIVQALVHMHDGRFELKSKLREGTEAIVAFPRKRVLEVMPPVDGAVDAPAPKRSVVSLRHTG